MNAKFHGNGGYPTERQRASNVFERGRVYRVTGGTMGRTHSELEIEGVKGRWNSILFDVDLNACPLEFSYGKPPHEETTVDLTMPDLVGYKCLGWANGWTVEEQEENRGKADDWEEVYSNERGTKNVVVSKSQRIYYLYDSGD